MLLLVSISLLGASTAAPAGADDAPAADRFLGTYGFSGGESEARSLQSTVDALVDDFNPLLRGLARRRLRRTVRVPERIEIATRDGAYRLTVVGAPDFPSEARYENGALVLRQSNFEGTRETHFHLSEDGRRLLMRVATRSALLPDQLDYQLSFERETPYEPQVSAGPSSEPSSRSSGPSFAGPAPPVDAGS